MKDYILIKDHGSYKKGQSIRLHPSTSEAFKKLGYIAKDKKPRAKKSE